MFEGSYSYWDIKNIDDEIKDLSCLLNKFKEQSEKIDNKMKLLKNIYKAFDEEIKNNHFNVNKTIKYIKDNNLDKEHEAKKLFVNFCENLEELQKNKIKYFSELFFKNTIANLDTFIKNLKEQKEIIEKHIHSIRKEEHKELNSKILEYESSIYNRFYPTFSRYIDLQKYSSNHLRNALFYDSSRLFTFLFKYKLTSLYSFVIFAAILWLPYFLDIGKAPTINLNNMTYSVLITIFYFISFFFIILGFWLFKTYFLTELTKTNDKYLNFFFYTYNIVLFFILLLPFLYKLNFKKINNFLEWIDFNTSIIILFIMNAIFAIYSFYKTKNIDNAILYFMITLASDLILILFVYIKYEQINFVILIVIFVILISMGIISIKQKIFYYKEWTILSSFILLIFFVFMSKTFVNVSGIANYRDGFTMQKKIIPKSILNLPYCFDDYKFTCINKDITDKRQVTFKNLLVKLKRDNYYELRAVMPLKINKDDINITAQDFKSFFKFKECNENNTTCYSFLEGNKTITIKNYSIKFKDFKKDKKDKIFKDFKIKESNILN